MLMQTHIYVKSVLSRRPPQFSSLAVISASVNLVHLPALSAQSAEPRSLIACSPSRLDLRQV
jgi:hypothetical protein